MRFHHHSSAVLLSLTLLAAAGVSVAAHPAKKDVLRGAQRHTMPAAAANARRHLQDEAIDKDQEKAAKEAEKLAEEAAKEADKNQKEEIEEKEAKDNGDGMMVNDKGCDTSAGYGWCTALDQCVHPLVTDCPGTPSAKAAYLCSSTGGTIVQKSVCKGTGAFPEECDCPDCELPTVPPVPTMAPTPETTDVMEPEAEDDPDFVPDDMTAEPTASGSAEASGTGPPTVEGEFVAVPTAETTMEPSASGGDFVAAPTAETTTEPSPDLGLEEPTAEPGDDTMEPTTADGARALQETQEATFGPTMEEATEQVTFVPTMENTDAPTGVADEEEATIMPGSDRDDNGCIPSAGYEWCESLSECVRPWETDCPKEDAEGGGGDPPMLGGDVDENGCIPSAGYSWCASLAECVRPWETDCPKEDDNNAMLGGDVDENGCIPSAGYEWCASLSECVRPWETDCPEESGGENAVVEPLPSWLSKLFIGPSPPYMYMHSIPSHS